ncbi:hypothetical protein BY996DRAFT_1191293 [Phakopsora pachyrhizi]|nr:hypothetical protein BY996DRAFT_1191293 [Phakopsora pachyrhizi]
MQLLDANISSEASDVEVEESDQLKINRFSNLNIKFDELESLIKSKNEERDYLNELETELMMLDESELKLSDSMKELQSELDDCNREMEELKKTLYSKFGRTINLERKDD